MKIGVAFSGSGVGAPWSHIFAEELHSCAVPIQMLSATSLAAVPVLLWSKGCSGEEIQQWMQKILLAPALGCKQLVQSELIKKPCEYPVAMSSVDILSGISVLYADGLQADAWNLKVHALTGNEDCALTSAVSPYGGMEPPIVDKMKLCDFSLRYGCPFFPLKMAGIERILSVSFPGGNMPVQAAGDNMSALTGRNAELHLSIKPDSAECAESFIRSFIQNNIGAIYQKLLF